MKLRIAATIILAIFICGTASSQDKNRKKVEMTGKIVNKDSIPVSNVMIFLDGQNTNIMTSANGEFKLKLKPDVKKISFYSPADGIFEIDYVGQARLEIIMNHDASMISTNSDQVGEIVEEGYGTISRDDQTGSISSIKGNRFKNRSYPDVYAMIADEAPGVVVEGGRTIRIRGISSLNGSNDPLLIVDGSPVVSFDNISPNDVESITVLKGSSTAIYGNRGAAGVVIIKTKSGNKK